MAARNIKNESGPKEFKDVPLVCGDDYKILTQDVLKSRKNKTNGLSLNVEKQVERKIEEALIKVENNEEEIKIRPNSGKFKVISEDVLGLTVGQEFKTEKV